MEGAAGFVCRSAQTVDAIAKSSIEAIVAKEKARREMKDYRASLGIHDTLKEAQEWLNKHYKEYENPLYIEEDSDRFLVKECSFRDSDGIPIHDGDTVFLPDDSFFTIHFTEHEISDDKFSDDDDIRTLQTITRSLYLTDDNPLRMICYECLPVDGFDDHCNTNYMNEMNSWFDTDEEKRTGIMTDNVFKLRAWEETEKQEWLNGIIDKYMAKELKSRVADAANAADGFKDIIIMIVCVLAALALILVIGVALAVTAGDAESMWALKMSLKVILAAEAVLITARIGIAAILRLVRRSHEKKADVEANEIKSRIQKILEETGELDGETVRKFYGDYTTDKDFRVY